MSEGREREPSSAAHELVAGARTRRLGPRRSASGVLLTAVVLGTGSGLLTPSGAEAFSTLVSQDRRVRASYSGSYQTTSGVYPVSGQNATVAPDFADFVATVSTFGASAAQISSLAPHRLAAGGTMSAEGYLELGTGTVINVTSTARSQFSVTFEVHTQTPFVLDGALDGRAVGYGTPLEARIELLDGATLVAEIPCVETSPPPNRTCTAASDPIEGVLEPGVYTLVAVVESTGTPSSFGGPAPKYGSGEFTVGLDLGSPEAVPGLGSGVRVVLAALLAATGARVALRRPDRAGRRIGG